MPRPFRCRKIGQMPVYCSFSPDDIKDADSILMTVDEFETIRLLDYEGLTQEVYGKRPLITGGYCEFDPVEINQSIVEKGIKTMRIAITYENGDVFQHFGHCEKFKLYDVEDGKIVNEQIVDTNGSGHGALAGFLQALKVDALICGGIGMSAQTALSDAAIKFYAGVNGEADKAAKALIEGNLEYDPNACCDHHDHHGGEHNCKH